MNKKIYLNDDWYFSKVYGQTESEELVRIPHTVEETPLNYFSETIYEKVSGYRKKLFISKEQKEKSLLLTFEGVAHHATVFINDKRVGEHGSGYTAFTIDITPYVCYEEENTITVRVDSRESLNIPPFGNLIDYMTYGGIYREVYLEEREKNYLEDVWVTTKDVLAKEKTLCIQTTLNELREGLSVQYRLGGIENDEEALLGEEKAIAKQSTIAYKVKNKKLWDTSMPYLYILKVSLLAEGVIIDEKEITVGFREAIFKKDGFYLNGKKTKIRGMNRHQSYPYVGYAMPKSQQVLDAHILKKELGLNAVRTSHYPQSHHFIEACDQLGLLVFTEIPGWQHIGDELWKAQAYTNTQEMIREYRNHPSIVLWGVRINESPDDELFYANTNEIAHKLDPYRQTAGVRNIRKGDFQEDVYTYNDFSHVGDNRGIFKKGQVTPDKEKAYFISEYNGHMFPTKAFDDEVHRLAHSLRHARVIEDYYKAEEVAGGFAWCMFDYNTHKEFGSGDNICHHGVMDAFRNPKMAAAVYAAQGNEMDVLEISSTMNIGEHPGGFLRDIYLFTNADEVKFYKNDKFVKIFRAEDSEYKAMPRGPIRIDDLVGKGLESEEGYDEQKAEKVKKLLNNIARYGVDKLPLVVKLTIPELILRYGMTVKEIERLYITHVGNWGGKIDTYRFEAIREGKVVKTVTKTPNSNKHLEVRVDHTTLIEAATYDVATVRIQICDDYGNRLPYYQEPLTLAVEGELELIGPHLISMKGGMGGTYVKTTGKAGSGKLIIKMIDNSQEEILFETHIEKR